MNFCRVSIDEIAHDIPAGKYQAAIVSKTAELLEGRFDPLSDDNFSCFFSADLSHQQMNILLLMREFLQKNRFELAGLMFYQAIRDFYEGLAKQEAQDQIDNADCRQCFDSGCASCFEPEVE